MEKILENFVNNQLPRNTMGIFVNPDKPYNGTINKKHQTFSFNKNYNRTTGYITSFTGKYYIENNFIYIEVILKPSTLFILGPIALFMIGVINNYNTPLIIIFQFLFTFVLLLLLTVLPYNSTGNEILTSFYKHLKPYILEETDIAPRYSKF